MNFITILNWLLELEQSKETASLVATHKDTIYTKLALMPWIDGNLGHTLSTLLFYQIEPLKNGASLILPSSIARNS